GGGRVDDRRRRARCTADGSDDAAVARPDAELRAWRRHVARAANVGEATICSDFVLRGLLERPPANTDELAERLGVTPHAAARLKPLPTVQSSSTMTGA